MEDRKIVLLDGDSLLYGAFCGIPGEESFQGVLNLFFKALEEEQADHGAVVLSGKEQALYQDFHGFVKEKLEEQERRLKKALEEKGVLMLSDPEKNSAALLASLAGGCKKQETKAVILSWDENLLQLVNDFVTVKILNHGQEGLCWTAYSQESLAEAFEPDFKGYAGITALVGDRLKGISGVPGIGRNTAKQLMRQFKTIENLYSCIEEVKSQRIRENLLACREAVLLGEKAALLDQTEELLPDYESCRAEAHTEKKADFSEFMPMYEDPEPENASSIEQFFHSVTDFSEAEALFAQIPGGGSIGLQLVAEAHKVSALSLCFNGEKCYCFVPEGFLTPDYLAAKAAELCSRAGHVTVLDLKPQLEFLNLKPDSPVMDAGVAAYLLDPLKDSYSYDSLARCYLGVEAPSRTELIGKASVKRALEDNFQKAVTYVCYLSYVAFHAENPLKTGLKETQMERLFYEIEMPLIYSLHHMEEAGIQVERQQLKEYGDKLKVRITELEKKIYEETGESFNINSPKQLGEILFEHMKLPGGKKTKTGYSTAADVLEKLAGDHPVVQLILDYRQLTKLNSTYADGLAAYIGPDERIHGTFNQTITATGRISSTEPNLQNIPVRMELGREIRKVFVPKKGCVFIDADYSQIELRVLAHMSGDERLINAYKQAEDIHAITASQVFHIPLDQVTPLQRRNAKAVNFGIVYGISSFGLSEGLSITRKEASEYIEKYFETYPGVKLFLDKLVRDAKEEGFAVSMYGRRRPVPELKSSNFNQRSFGERAAMNSPIQGTAADIIKIAMIRVDQALRRQGLKSRIVLQVHDELLIETLESEINQVKELLVNEMKHAADLKVALEVEAKEGASWFDAK